MWFWLQVYIIRASFSNQEHSASNTVKDEATNGAKKTTKRGGKAKSRSNEAAPSSNELLHQNADDIEPPKDARPRKEDKTSSKESTFDGDNESTKVLSVEDNDEECRGAKRRKKPMTGSFRKKAY